MSDQETATSTEPVDAVAASVKALAEVPSQVMNTLSLALAQNTTTLFGNACNAQQEAWTASRNAANQCVGVLFEILLRK